MSIISWLVDRLGRQVSSKEINLNELTDEYISIVGDIYIRELAFWSCYNVVANALSKCEFKTFMGNKEVKGYEYYLWNIEPNKNQNSSGFIHKLIAKLYKENECLIIEQNQQLLIADSFSRKPYALLDDVFTNVVVGDLSFNRAFYQSEVLYFQLSEKNMHKVISGLYEAYSKLIIYNMKSFLRSRGLKGKFTYDTLPATGTEQRKIFDDLVNNKFKAWLQSDGGVIPLGKGQEFTELTQRTYANETSRDIRAMIDDICDFSAKGFGIPTSIIRGDVQDTSKAVDQLLTFCIDPLADMIAEEINRKRIGYAGFAAGNYLVIDTKTIKHIDLLSVATAIDKLIGSGAFCINDIRKACGEPELDEPWAKQHFMTKNYSTVEEALAALGIDPQNTG